MKTTSVRVTKTPMVVKNKPKDESLSKDQKIEALRQMMTARMSDEKTIVLYKQNKCFFQIGCAGHEAIGIAASMVFKSGHDWFYPYYREMPLMVGLGMSSEEIFLNAMNKPADPNSHGLQMPMHWGSKKLNVVNQSSPTGTQFLQAVGSALAARKLKKNDVTYVSSGEGTCSQGDFHEALNWASREKLPVVFSIHNNSFAISVPISEQLGAKSIYDLTQGYENLARFTVDGSDLEKTYTAFKAAYTHAKSGAGPALVESHVARLQSHSISDDHTKYRTKAEIEAEKKRCPIEKLKTRLISEKIISEKEFETIQNTLKKEIDAASERAESAKDHTEEDSKVHVFQPHDPALETPERPGTGEDVYIVDAVNHALDETLADNKHSFIFGQDVAHGKGGVFTVTTGLTKKHGNDRVFNSPLAESSILGVAIGMATRGLKPMAEIQFGDYIWTAMMQIRNELAMLSYRSAGDFTAPAIIRVPVGGYIRGGSYHSQCIEGTFSHFPGLHIVYPSNGEDAYGLFKAAAVSNNPVLFLEHKGLYRQPYAKGKEGGFVPFGKAKVVREGSDLTIITWGALVQKSILAAKELEKSGTQVEVIDLRSIVPLDKETIIQSVKKTNRVVIAQEDVLFMGFASEIAAMIADECFTYLDAPVKRVGMDNVASLPHSPILEEIVLPQTHDVVSACQATLSF